MTDLVIRKCPNCKKEIVKSEGCNKIICSCNTIFCYICGIKCANNNLDYSHFGNKCKLYDQIKNDTQEIINKQPKYLKNSAKNVIDKINNSNTKMTKKNKIIKDSTFVYNNNF